MLDILLNLLVILYKVKNDPEMKTKGSEIAINITKSIEHLDF
jgi:hypothetical protein